MEKLVSLLVVLSFLIAGCAGRITKEKHQSLINKKNQKIANLKSKAVSQEDRADSLSQKVKKLQSQLDDLRNKLTLTKAKLERKSDTLMTQKEKLQSQNQKLQQRLSKLKQTEARREGENLVLTLPEQILFNLGEANLKPDARETLREVGSILAEFPNRFVMVQGHADTVPITNSWRFSSNWDLSAQRAVSVVEFLTQETPVTPDRIIASGYGDQHPVAPNNNPENRRLNRRVEIVLFPPDLPRKKINVSR